MKQKTYEGYGIWEMLRICKKFGLTKFNSDLQVKNYNDFSSKWTIKTKG